MADKYDSNGDYGSYTDNFKRKSVEKTDMDGENEESNPIAQKVTEFVRELLAEKLLIEPNKLPHACRLLDQEIVKAQQTGKVPFRDMKYVDIYREKPVKVTVKVLVPVREHPKFNFVGKLLGPKGNSMKRLQEETMCKMAVLGKGSMKDRNKEEELRNSLDPKYAHLSDDLHVEISALGPPAEAHARVAFALAEVRKYLVPDNNDNIRQEQMREMEIMSGDPAERVAPARRSILRKASASIPRPGGPGPMRTATRSPVVSSRSVMPAKTKIMSILDRARIAMEESYGYEEEAYEPVPPPPPVSYERYAHPPSKSHSSHYYDYEYEPEYYRESSSSYEPSSTRWKRKSPSSSDRPSESRYRTSPYSRPSK